MTIKLHCFGESGNSYKAALALELSGLDWEPVFVDFFAGEARTPEWRESVNEMGEAPVLVDDDFTLSQSGAIQIYISGKTGKFGGQSKSEHFDVLRWVLWDNHKLSSVAGLTRFLINFLPEKHRNPDVIAFHQGRLKAAYDILNTHLDGRDWIVGDDLTNADISCCG
ncbi:MAG: glutathione S-transferase, partial [Pseudomonadota bacterium]